MNGGTLGFMFTAKDLASGTFARQNKNVKALAANSQAAAAVYEQSMARMRRGAVMLGVAIVGLAVMTKVTKTFGEFQYTLASAGAVMHATAGEMKMLERAAIDAGIATQFSPREAAEGLQALGAAGLSASKAVQVLNPVLDLAAASMGQLGVAGAAENVVGVLNAFSMQADKAGMVADKLTRISQLTNFQFRDFGVAISQAAAQAYTADQSFESMLATLGMLRNTNLHASAAATSYREAVRRLSGDKRAHKELSKLSIDVLDKETGKIRDLGAIMTDLAPKLEKLNSKEKNLRATRIFGVRGMKTYAAFVSQYRKLVDEGVIVTGDWAGAHSRLVDELGRSEGAAKKNRDALLQTAEGQRLLLKGSWETTQIMLGKLALPAVLPALKAVTDVLNIFIKLLDAIPGPARNMLATIVGGALAVKALTGAFGMLRGLGAIAMLNRIGDATAAAGDASQAAATKQGFLNRQLTVTRRLGVSGAASIASMASMGLVLAPIFMGIASYFEQADKKAEERRKRMIRQNIAAKESYEAAMKMAVALRAATARSLAAELKAGAKTEKAAKDTYYRMLSRVREHDARVTEQYKQYQMLLLYEGASAKKTVAARAEWVKMSAKSEIVNAALIESQANLAKFQIGSARTVAEKQLLGRRILAQRMVELDAMRARHAKREAGRETALGLTSEGKERNLAAKRFARERAAEVRAEKRFRRRSARLAVRWHLADKDLLKSKEQERTLRKITDIPTARVPLHSLIKDAPPEWRMAAQEGRLPRGLMRAEELKRFAEFAKMARIGGGFTQQQAAQFQHLIATAGAGFAARGPGAMYAPGGRMPARPMGRYAGMLAPIPVQAEAERPSPLSAGGMFGPGEGSELVGLADIVARAVAQAIRDTPPQVYLDGDKVSTKIQHATGRRNRQNDGTTTTTTTVRAAG